MSMSYNGEQSAAVCEASLAGASPFMAHWAGVLLGASIFDGPAPRTREELDLFMSKFPGIQTIEFKLKDDGGPFSGARVVGWGFIS
jgi:hypothetical protein